jgi:hypothetical protein
MLAEADLPATSREHSAARDPRARTANGRWRVARLVPLDPFHYARIAMMIGYGLTSVWWTRTRGLVIDRISVAAALGMFLLCANLGRPWRRWAQLALDAALYCLMWFGYEMTRGLADQVGMPLQVHAMLNIDRVLFLGTDPTVWLQQRLYEPGNVHWYDQVLSLTYYTHFWLPVVALGVLWATRRYQWKRFMKRLATLLAIACTMFVLLPTAPPWMVASPTYPYQLLPPLARHTGEGLKSLGFLGFFHDWNNALDWTNAVAAMPSLHAGFALFVPAFFLPMVKPWWGKALMMLFPLAMLTALVYFAEHWVIDGLVGWALVGVSFLMWNRIERHQRGRRAAQARIALEG